MILITRPKPEELTSSGFTNRIKIESDQTKESLMKYGFTNYREGYLYFCKMIKGEISFNLSVEEDTLEIERIDVLNEESCQPFDYQFYLSESENNEFALDIYHGVNEIFNKMQEDGIITGFVEGMYV